MRDLTKKIVPIAAVIAVLMAGGAAALRAQNLVLNPSFELGNPQSGFTVPDNWSFVQNDCLNGTFDASTARYGPGYLITPKSGSWEMWFGASCTPGIAQSIVTGAGQGYTLSFWERVSPNQAVNNPNYFAARFNGTALFETPLSGSPIGLTNLDWFQMTFNVVGTGQTGGDLISFFANNSPGGTELDDVSLTSTSVTPEPASLVLLATGLFGMGGLLRFRRKKNA